MKTMAKILSVATAMAGTAMVPVAAHADVSYNVGFASEYYYRGFSKRAHQLAQASTLKKAVSMRALGPRMSVRVLR